MDRSEAHLLNIADSYISRITNIKIDRFESTIGILKSNKSIKQDWSNKAGVYYFIQDDTVKYVGKANLNTGLRARIYNQIEAVGEVDRWDTVILDNSVKCGLFIFADDDWYWIVGLELILFDKLRPQMNKRSP